MMTTLKRNRLWLALTLVVALLTVATAPAYVPACVDPGIATTASAAASGVCAATGQPGACCCGHDAVASGRAPFGSALVPLHQCDCSLDTPPPAPARAEKATGFGFNLLAVAALPHTPSLDAPAPTAWRLPLRSTGPPGTPDRLSSPSRAPPTC